MEKGTELRQRETKENSDSSHPITNAVNNHVKVVVTDIDDEAPQNRNVLSNLKRRCRTFCTPFLRRKNPLPEYPTWFQKLRHSCMLPLLGNTAHYVLFIILMVQIWMVLFSLFLEQALPGGNLFSLLILFIACAVGGYLISFARLPPLLGMLIVGVMLRNIPGIKTVGESIDPKWSGVLRKVALTVILTRAGLGLDVVKLKKLSWAVLRLAFLPCAAEALTAGIVSHYLLEFPWKWSLMLGCIMAALSPAVTVPSLVNLQDRRYGVAKGIPTMLLAAGGLDNVLCVTGFSVFMGIIFTEGSMAVTIIKGPLGACLGVVYGFVMGTILWYLPAKDSSNSVFYRSMLLFGSGMIAIFGSSQIGLSGAGPLGCLTTATVASYKWRQRRKPGEVDEIAGVMALAWLIVQHFLFGLIGAAVNIGDIGQHTAGLGIATLAVGLIVRSLLSSTVTLGTGFNTKERAFITFTWLSKATVQAAIGGLALDKALEAATPDPEQVRLGTDVLTISVLAIVICAPTGATLMAMLGPRFLAKGGDGEVELEVCKGEKDEVKKDSGVNGKEVVISVATGDVEVIDNEKGLKVDDDEVNFMKERTLSDGAGHAYSCAPNGIINVGYQSESIESLNDDGGVLEGTDNSYQNRSNINEKDITYLDHREGRDTGVMDAEGEIVKEVLNKVNTIPRDNHVATSSVKDSMVENGTIHDETGENGDGIRTEQKELETGMYVTTLQVSSLADLN